MPGTQTNPIQDNQKIGQEKIAQEFTKETTVQRPKVSSTENMVQATAHFKETTAPITGERSLDSRVVDEKVVSSRVVEQHQVSEGARIVDQHLRTQDAKVF